nr:DNA-binding protein HEXBP-like [Dermacentor andersoni]
MADIRISFTAGFSGLSCGRGANIGMEAATAQRPCGAGWGAVGFAWRKELPNAGALEAGAVCLREANPHEGELPTIYGDVGHRERGRSARSTTGRTDECNQEGHMSRDCPTAHCGGRRGCLRCGEEGHMSRD